MNLYITYEFNFVSYGRTMKMRNKDSKKRLRCVERFLSILQNLNEDTEYDTSYVCDNTVSILIMSYLNKN